MDDAAFQDWSEKLTELRKKRQVVIDQQMQEKAGAFSPADFFEGASASLENIMEAWLGFEEKTWETMPPADPAAALASAVGEMESILDFELDAIDRDRASVASRSTWEAGDVETAGQKFQSFTNDLRKRYQLKMKAIAGGGSKKKPPEIHKPLPQANFSGGSRGGSGVGLFLMFLVGLLFGGGPSIYFMNTSKESERKFQEDRSKILSDQRALADSMTVLHDSFEQVALGKIKNIPELEKEIGQIKVDILNRKQRVEADFEQDRGRMLRKIPPGDKQDTALAKLDEDRNKKLAEIERKGNLTLDPLVLELNRLKELIR